MKPSKKPVRKEPPTPTTPKPAPPRQKMVARKCYGMEDLDRLDRMRKELFEADAARFKDRKRAGYGEWKGKLTAAFGYWIAYPMYLEMAGHDWHADGTRTAAYYALNHAHTEATRVLMEEAERHGLDPYPLYECGRVVLEIYADAPEKFYSGPHDTWPECMGAARYSLPQGQQDALRAGEAVFIRLAVKTGITAKEDMGEIARKVKPPHRPPIYDPVKDAKIVREWEASRATPHKPTMAEFEEVHGLGEGELQRVLDRCRKRQKRDGHKAD